MKTPPILRLPALEVQQTGKRTLYSFAVDGKALTTFAAVSRLQRDAAAKLGGYQRPEVLAHIAGIRTYLESADPLLPNALVVAFDSRVRFRSTRATAHPCGYARPGELLIPIDPAYAEADKPGWIVDGQQRVAAVREADIASFPLCVTAFITDSQADQRTQFILVNSTKALPKGLIYELLPGTKGTLPRQLQVRVLPSRVLERLNHDLDSPLRHLINTPTTPEGLIKDNSVLKMLENSLSDGALYPFRELATRTGDLEEMLTVVKNFWEAVRWVFPNAFGKPPRRSRLMHGVGIVSLGFVMDAIAVDCPAGRMPQREDFASALQQLEPACHWTAGTWDFGSTQRRWNDLQNTPRDMKLLTDYFRDECRRRLRKTDLRVVAS
jgi:DGQHR domain-containing protein